MEAKMVPHVQCKHPIRAASASACSSDRKLHLANRLNELHLTKSAVVCFFSVMMQQRARGSKVYFSQEKPKIKGVLPF